MIDRDGPVPFYQQIASVLREMIRSGELPPDRPIPSKRTLAQEYGVAMGTVEKTLRILKDEGLVTAVKGKGMYVTRRRLRA